MLAALRERLTSGPRLWRELWNLFKYGVVGVTSLGVSMGVYAFLSRIMWEEGPKTLFSVLATIIASAYNFMLHRSWTFNARAFSPAMVIRYLIVFAVGTALSGLLFYIGHEVLGFYDLLVNAAVPFLCVGVTYFLHRWYTFHPRHDAPPTV